MDKGISLAVGLAVMFVGLVVAMGINGKVGLGILAFGLFMTTSAI